jgi:hypothetical protein
MSLSSPETALNNGMTNSINATDTNQAEISKVGAVRAGDKRRTLRIGDKRRTLRIGDKRRTLRIDFEKNSQL